MKSYFEQSFPATQQTVKNKGPDNMIDICLIPCLQDNYGLLVHERISGETICVDTPDGHAILQVAKEKKWTISQIWNTHHHADHTQGNALVKAQSGAQIIAPAREAKKIPQADRYVHHGDHVYIGTLKTDIMALPGHTLGHIGYFIHEMALGFVGDVLFVLGCGRVFEGSMEDMWQSLEKIRALPDPYTLYCAHEYAQGNARFACSLDPDNPALQKKMAEISQTRQKGLPCLPIHLEEERKINPFLRAQDPFFAKKFHLNRPEQIFAKIRKAKDQFHG